MDVTENSFRGQEFFKNINWNAGGEENEEMKDQPNASENDGSNLGFKTMEETEDCAYLGDEPSVHDFTKYSVKEFRLLKPFDKRHSLDSLIVDNAIPFFMKLPVITSNSTMVDLLESISAMSWMLPFLLASSPPLNSKNIPKLILSNNTEHLRLLNAVKGVKGSFTSLPTIIEDPTTLLKNNIAVKSEIITRVESDEYFVANISSSPSFASHSSPDSTAAAIAHNINNNNLNGHGYQNRNKFSKLCYYLNDSIISSEALISSWKCLGTVLISNDSKLWELRNIMLFNNYLFECSTQSSMTIIGFACLNQANIQLADYSPISSNTHPHNQYARTRSESDVGLPSVIIEISYLRTCSMTSQRGNVFIRCATAEDTEAIKQEIIQAAELSLEQLFKINYNDEKNNLLSKGRYTEVRKAIRKYHSNSDACLNELLFENTTIKKSVHNKYNLDISKVQDDVDLSLLSLEGDGSTSSTSNGHKNIGTSNGGMLKRLEKPSHLKHSQSLSQLMTRSAPSKSYNLLPVISTAASTTFKSPNKNTRQQLLTNKNQQLPYHFSYMSPVECALKIIRRDQFAERVESGRERADCLVREALAQTLVCRIGKQLGLVEKDLPVVSLNCIFETTDLLCLDLELMHEKDLFEVFQSNDVFPEVLVKSIVIQMVKSLILCRLAGIVHRDVKLSNITIVKTTGTVEETHEYYEKDFRVKLADFGMAGFCDKEGRIKGRCGTLGYVAPEILNTEANEWYFGAHADVFSLGVVAYTLLVGYEPFTGQDDNELKEANRAVLLDFNPVDWEKVSREAVDWISSAMHPNPKQRLSPDDALKHPWLATSSSTNYPA